MLTRGEGAGRVIGSAASVHRCITDEAGPSHRERSSSPLRRSPSPSQSTDSVGPALREGDVADLSILATIFTGVEDMDEGVTDGEMRQRTELERIEEDEEEEELPLRQRSWRTSQAEIA